VLHDLGREVRLARITGGLTQADVAARAGTSPAQLSRLENGHLATMSIISLHRVAAAVGLRLFARCYPAGRRLLDRAQIALLDRFRARIHPAWQWRLEVPVPLAGDLRAADATLTLPGCVIVVEAITRLADLQAQLRAAQLKRRDIGAARLILLVSDSTANRQAIREAGPMLDAALPLRTRAAVTVLGSGADPGADALIVL
jgi:transcriptional regulator with XRE-family HTH domain